MSWLKSTRQQLHIRHTLYMLAASTEIERQQAFESLLRDGEASRPHLQKLLAGSHSEYVRYTAAVLLHKLGDPTGLNTLKEETRQSQSGRFHRPSRLETAWVQIGSADAVPALLDVWQKMPKKGNYEMLGVSICCVWQQFRDPRVLPTLVKDALRIPKLFPETIAAFGITALPFLEPMLRDADVNRRLLALHALDVVADLEQHGAYVVPLLVPMLRDSEPEVRNKVPGLLILLLGETDAAQHTLAALDAGYSTYAAIKILRLVQPAHYAASLAALLDRWNPAAARQVERPAVSKNGNAAYPIQCGDDTQDAIIEAISALTLTHGFEFRLRPALYGLLKRQPSASLLCAIAGAFRAQTLSPSEQEQVRTVFWPLLSHTSPDVRKEATTTFKNSEAALHPAFVEWLTTCGEPREHISLQSRIEGTDFYSDVQWRQHGAWLTNATERAEVFGKADWLPAELFDADTRLPGLLAALLDNSLSALAQTDDFSAIVSMLVQPENVLLAMTLLPLQSAPIVRDSVLRALHTRKSITLYSSHALHQDRGNTYELGRWLRGHAVSALRHLYGPDSFALFVEALYADSYEVRYTAIYALGELGDARALPLLERVTQPLSPAEPNTLSARRAATLTESASQAIARIRRQNPEIMTLLRGSQRQTTAPNTLLRPANDMGHPEKSGGLLRPTEPIETRTP